MSRAGVAVIARLRVPVVPPGVVTESALGVPVVASAPIARFTVIWVGLTTLTVPGVTLFVALTVVLPATKFVPVIVSATPTPCAAVVTEIAVIDGGNPEGSGVGLVPGAALAVAPPFGVALEPGAGVDAGVAMAGICGGPALPHPQLTSTANKRSADSAFHGLASSIRIVISRREEPAPPFTN
jgi:hypothetical protein